MSNQINQSQNNNPRQNDPNQVTASPLNNPVYPRNTKNVQPATASPEIKRTSPWVRRFKNLFGTVQLVVGAILLAFVINAFVFQSYQVVGESMMPTLADGDRLIINKLGKSWDDIMNRPHIPNRGDIIVFNSPISDEKRLIKRVIGLPGDTVEVKNGLITIYNEEKPQGFNPDEEYKDEIPVDTEYNITTKVEDGKLFVAGDNRIGGASLDSRNDLGLVESSEVVGELVLRILPLSESKFF